ncbi:MAG: Holliday junction branch migration DNA helicase RuvB [Simkaniaceae bacterium]|nr:Holliday junction branch migration DNA helicase RuvB [Simkaniaceae bacterium]
MEDEEWTKSDRAFEQQLRPQSLNEFVGHEGAIQKLRVFLGAAKQREEPLGHVLLHGPPGLGKTTLASIIAKEMGTQIVTTSGPAIEKAGDLAGILTNLQEGDVLFIDEIHRLNRNIEEYLYPAIEDFVLDLMLDSGPSARSVQVTLNRFALVGATTRMGYLSSPLRSRFNFNCRLDYYPASHLQTIVLRSAQILRLKIEAEAALAIAQRSRGTPRIANNLLRWVRDYAQVHHVNLVDLACVDAALKMLNIDHRGLDEMDKKYLKVIIEHYEGGPVGVNTLSAALGEEETTLSEVYEPYLIMQGFLKRTRRGREVTPLAYEHLEEML